MTRSILSLGPHGRWPGIGWRKRRQDTGNEATGPTRICIVTPVYNGAAFLDDAIASVMMQAGDVAVQYHIQDGGSTDGTMRIVRRWHDLHRRGRLPILCRDITFTYASGPDAGLYDAVAKGFAQALPPGPDVMMGWIAADDRIAPGALATIAEVRRDLPDIRFMGGRICLLNEAGCVVDLMPMHAFARAALAAGLHDGRKLWYVMQEGTFWCADLWDKAGGLDPAFRYAGDWDLWRRIAHHADYASIDGLIGFHRKRSGQLSSEAGRYHEEVDRALDGPAALRDQYERTAQGLVDAGFGTNSFGDTAETGLAIRYDPEQGRWMRRHG